MELPRAAPQFYSKVHQWLEWERGVLRPAVYTKNGHQHLPAALKTLEEAVKGGEAKFLFSDVPSLADISIYSTLYPLKDTSMPVDVVAYLQKLTEQKSFQTGIQKVWRYLSKDDPPYMSLRCWVDSTRMWCSASCRAISSIIRRFSQNCLSLENVTSWWDPASSNHPSSHVACYRLRVLCLT